jgi:stress-induced-phosphoprotein 1
MSTAEEYKEKGNVEFRNKNYAAAIPHFTAGLELDPKNHILYSNRSACYASLQQWNEALGDANKCIELSPPGWGKGYARLGAALHGAKKYDEALKAYQKGLEADPTNDTLKERIQEVETDMKGGARANDPFGSIFGPDTFAKVQLNPKLAPYLLQPDYVQTLKLLIENPSMVQGFMQDPRISTTVIELLGINLQGRGGGEPPRAAPKPEAPKPKPAPAPEPPKDPATLAKERGNAHYKKREFTEALKCYDDAQSLDSKNAVYSLNRSSVYFELQEFDKCIAEISSTLEKIDAKELNADYVLLAKLMTRKAQVLQAQHKYPEAMESYQAALREHRNPDTLGKLNACEAEKKKWDVESYYDPELGAQAKERGNAFFKEQKFPEAVKEYTDSIKRHPKDHTVYSNRAAAYMKLGAYDDAVKDCEQCLSIEPNFLKCIVRLAHCYFWRKEYHKAAKEYERGLKIDNTNEECADGIVRTRNKIMESMQSGEVDEERIARAKNDPEIREILGDSYMQFVLREMSMDPKRADEYMADPNIAGKIQKLVQAGILSFGPQGSKKDEDEGVKGRKKR